MIKKNLFFFDAETDGLYGSFISVAMKVVEIDTGKVVDSLYCGIEKDRLSVKNPWVINHVLPYLGDYEACDSEEALIEQVWKFWKKHAEYAFAIADVTYPVECRLFEQCVAADQGNRMFEAPFPLLDLSSMLYAKGIDPLCERKQLITDLPQGVQHNAMYDVDVSIQIWKNIFAKTEDEPS